jgi:hypothetical protein
MVWGKVQVFEYGTDLSDCGTFVEVNWETGKQCHDFVCEGIFASAVLEEIRKPTLRLFYYFF